jgi:hypothetical protein
VIFLFLGACAHAPELTGFYGHSPAAPIEAPAFTAVNRDGAPRDPTALLGHPTVLWFYPLAASAG